MRELSSGETQVTIEWDAVDGATGYEVTRVWKKGKLVISWETTYIQVSADRTRFVDTGVERRAQYLYWVRTENRHGVGEKSPGAVNAQAGDPPSTSELAPSNLTAELLDRRVSLAWDAPAWDAASVTHYRIQRRPVGGRIDRTAYTRNADTAYVDATANEPGVRYAYWVKAIRGEKASAGSNEVEVDIPPDPCSEPGQANGEAPTPVEVEVTGVPIVVESSTDEYFVLYASHDFDGTEVEIPVSVTLGEAGTTTLSENVAMLPKERYRVQRYTVAHPADVDGDCVDDITELNDLGTMNPVNSARTIETTDGAVAIPDHAAFETMSYWDGPGRPMYMDFVIFHIDTDRPQVYFINSTNDMARLGWHLGFVEAIGLGSIWPQTVTGGIVYDPKLATPGGSPGSYYFQFSGGRRFLTSNAMLMVYTALAANMPVLEDNLALYWPNDDLWHLQSRLPALRDSRVPLVFEQDLLAEVDFLALNPGEGYGRLRVMDPDDRPHPYDIVVYEALPNELPRVAGIVSAVPQTPLSHVNLRAVQDGLPNAFIRNAAELDEIAGLVGSYVHYAVTETGWTLRAATPEEVEAHYASSRPGEEQAPERDLTITSITPLSDIGFEDWDAFGVKAANVAVLGTLGFPDGTVPDGFAVPFYFYDEFMKHNELYDYIDEMLADPDFQTDFDTQASDLKKLRKKIKKGKTLDWMIEALQTMHATYPEGQSLRYRSSTNNEDLPGFNGAGLYDSKTQHPEETEEDGIAKSLKQVFASLWNFRAFTEREFHRIDHRAAAMGVLVHPNYSDELANGVAASFDPIQNWEGRYYVNTQVGEDMVTNPDAHSVPEEILLSQGGGLWRVLGTSNQAPPGQLLMSEDQMVLLGRYLEAIHERFKELYGVEEGERFAMEIEFEITSGNVLAIKQARPWVFSPARESGGVANRPATGAPVVTGAAQVGETLDADTSGIADEDGLENASFSYQWLVDDTEIEGATGTGFTLTEADVGKAVKVRVSFTDDGGSEESLISGPTEAVAATTPGAPPHVSVAPGGTGELDVRWEAPDSDGGSPVTGYRVQWRRASGSWDNPTDVSESMVTATSYTITGLDYGEEYAVRVMAVSDAGEGASSAQQTGEPAELVEPPPAPRNLTVSLGPGSATLAWDAPDDNSVTGYQILRRRPPLGENELLVHVENTGSADASYTDTNDLTLGYRHVYRVLAINSAGLSGVSNYVRAVPTASGEMEPPPPPLGLAAAATGQEEVALRWDVLSGASQYLIEYRNADGGEWRTAGSSVGFATWTVTGPKLLTCGERYDFRVRAWDGGGKTYTAGWGPPSDAVSAATDRCNLDAAGLPSVSGTSQAGNTLAADTSGIDDADGMDNAAFTYQWLADDADIQGATGSTYTLADSDEGRTIRVRVSFTDDAGNEETLTSEPTTEVAARPNSPATGQPTITGTALVGETLTADTSGIADEDGLDSASFSYQWISNYAGTDSEIDGATGSTYTVTTDDVGKAIRVRVSFTDDRGHRESLSSAATASVAGLPPPPLTASVENAPASHDGESAFTFELRFSEEPKLGYKRLRDHAFTVTGGTVKKAERLEKGSNTGWRITVRPDGNGDVTVVLPVTSDCDAQGAICTADGRMLSNRNELSVSGPEG